MVKYIKKKSLVIMLLVCLMLLGCGSNKAPEPIRDTDSYIGNHKDITLSFIVPEYSENSIAWWKEFKASFEAKNKDIDLEVECFPLDKLQKSVEVIISSGIYPDGVLMDKAPGQELFEDEESPIIDEKIVFGQTRKLLVNKEILEKNGIEEIPGTWQELLETCRAIKRGTGEIPFGLSLLDDEAINTFACFAWNAGGGFTDKDGNWKLDSSRNVYTLEYEKRLISSGYTNPNPEETSVSELTESFLQGELAMMIATDTMYKSIEDISEGYVLVNMPTHEDRTSITYLSTDSFYTFNIEMDDKEERELREDAIERFYEAFFDKDTLDSFAISEGGNLYSSIDQYVIYSILPTDMEGWQQVKDKIIEIQTNLFDEEESLDTLTRLQEDILLYLDRKQ